MANLSSLTWVGGVVEIGYIAKLSPAKLGLRLSLAKSRGFSLCVFFKKYSFSATENDIFMRKVD